MRPVYVRLCNSALVFLCLARVISAQSAANKYSAEPFVLERVDVVYVMNADGTGYMQKTVIAKIQSEAALQQFGILGMEFAGNSQHVEFHYVRSRRADGSVTETPLSGVMEQPLQATVQAPFYSDLKIAQIPVKNLQVGDTLEWEGRVVMTKAEAPNEFWAEENFVTEGSVVLEQSLELHVPAAKSVTVWTSPALGIKVKESADGDAKVYRWQTQELQPTVGPEAEAAKEAKKKHVLTAEEELDEERGKLPSVAWTTFPSWAAVGEWYRGLELSRTTPDDEIKAKVAELTAGKTSDEDKAKAIYEYVSTQVRYIGVAFGVGRYQPHEAVDVLHNQYGDCKDKATLLSAMLAAAGVPSDAALIGAGIRFNEAVPSPAAFNHLITHLKLNGQDVWLDSTEEVAPYRMMYAFLRDREALVVSPAGAPMIEKTPKDPPFAAFQKWTAKGTLDTNGVSQSHITIALRGDDELAVRAAARQIGPAQYPEFAQRMMNAVGYSGTSSHAEFSRPEDVDKPLTIDLDYRRDRSDDWSNLRIVPQLAPVPLPAIDDKEPPVKSWTLDESAATLRGKTSLLVASWDTMGWILFREGKAREARSFIEAASENGTNPELKTHLDELDAALGVRANRATAVKADVTVTRQAMQGQQLRTFPLGPANGRHGVAEYKLLLSHGKVERMEPTSEKAIEGADAMVKSVGFGKLFPEGSDAKLVRAAMVNCFGDKCQLVLEP